MPASRIELETEKFRNYWTAKTGTGAVKRDWAATWRNWILNATEGRHVAGNNRRGPPGAASVTRRAATGADAVLAGMGRLAHRLAETRSAARPTTGQWREIPTLPANLILRAAEREELARHASALYALCRQVPANDSHAENETLLAVTKMMLVLPSTTQNEVCAEREARRLWPRSMTASLGCACRIRQWYRGDCGKNDKGQPYDCHWCPAPAELRQVAGPR